MINTGSIDSKISKFVITIGTSTSLGGSITLIAIITNGSGIQSNSITSTDLNWFNQLIVN